MSDPLRISASQLGTFWQCPRKWFFSKVLKMAEPKKGYFCFGTVLHAVAERYAAGDDQGRVPYPHECPAQKDWKPSVSEMCYMDGPLAGQKFGEQIDMYPEDWRWSYDFAGKVKEQEVDESEAIWIRELIQEAIDKGLLMRWAGRTLEREININVIPGANLVGYIDVDIVTPETNVLKIKDYKTFSQSGSRFLKNEETLKTDSQQNIYAYVRAGELGKQDEDIEVEHIQFPKYRNSRKGVRAVQAMTTPEFRSLLWKRIQDTAALMIDVKASDPAEFESLMPEEDGACQAYGGCAYATVCSGIETMDQYRTTIEEYNKLSQEERDNNPRRRVIYKPHAEADASAQSLELEAAIMGGNNENDMSSIFDGPGKSTTSSAKKETKSKPKPAKKETKDEGTTATMDIDLPWANAECPLCKGSGLLKGRPCKICDATAKKRGVEPSSALSAEELEAFLSMAEPEADPLASRKEEVKEIVEETIAEQTAEDPVEQEEEEEEPAADEEVAPEPEPKKEKAKKAPRKKKGPLLFINGSVIKDAGSSTTIQEVLEKYGTALAEAVSKESYWELDPFKRKDMLGLKAAAIADELGTVTVICNNMSHDCVTLVSHLTAHSRVHQGA